MSSQSPTKTPRTKVTRKDKEFEMLLRRAARLHAGTHGARRKRSPS
jgi:hypothetical protein